MNKYFSAWAVVQANKVVHAQASSWGVNVHLYQHAPTDGHGLFAGIDTSCAMTSDFQEPVGLVTKVHYSTVFSAEAAPVGLWRSDGH